MEFLNALRGERFIHQQYYSIILKIDINVILNTIIKIGALMKLK